MNPLWGNAHYLEFVRDICRHPGSQDAQAARRALADWLQDNGHGEDGERLARAVAGRGFDVSLRWTGSAWQLHTAVGDIPMPAGMEWPSWTNGVHAFLDPGDVLHEGGGFGAAVVLANAATWMRKGPYLCRWQPITRVVLPDSNPASGLGLSSRSQTMPMPAYWPLPGSRGWEWVRSTHVWRHEVPPEWFDLLDNGGLESAGLDPRRRAYPYASDALNDLERAMLRWGRRLAAALFSRPDHPPVVA